MFARGPLSFHFYPIRFVSGQISDPSPSHPHWRVAPHGPARLASVQVRLRDEPLKDAAAIPARRVGVSE